MSCKFFLSFCLLAILCFPGVAQSTTDKNSQLRELNAMQSRAELYMKNIASFNNKIPDSIITLADQLEQVSNKISYARGLEKSYFLQLGIWLHNWEYKKKKKENGTEELARAKLYENKILALAQARPVDSTGVMYNKIAETYLNADENYPGKIELVKKALTIFESTKNYRQKSISQHHLGYYYLQKGDFETAEKYLTESIAAAKAAGKNDIHHTLALLCNIHTHKGDHKTAIEYGIEAVKTGERLNDRSIEMAAVYNYTGMPYHAMRDAKNALFHYSEAVEISKKHKDVDKILEYSGNVALLNVSTDPAGVIVYLEDLIKKYPAEADNNRYLTTYNRLLIANTRLKDTINAEKYVKKLLNMTGNFSRNSPEQSFIYVPVVRYYVSTKQFDKAAAYLAPYLAIVKEVKVPSLMQQAYDWQYQIDEGRGNYKAALVSQRNLTRLKDSIYDVDRTKQFNELSVKYDTEKKDKELKLREQDIQLLSQEQELQRIINQQKDKDIELGRKDIALLVNQQELQVVEAAKKDNDLLLKDQRLLLKEKNINLLTAEGLLKETALKSTKTIRNFIIGGAVMLLLLLGLLYNRYKLKQVSNININRQNIALQQMVKEKEWLLKEVHHRVKNNLQTVVSLLESQSAYLKSDALLAIQDSQNRIYAMSLVHQKLYQPQNVASIDMKHYITELTEYLKNSFNEKHIQFNTNILSINLDVSQAIPVGLIINEAITNSVKYAFPDKNVIGTITINLTENADDLLHLEIKDNGVGFAENKSAANAGLGLKLIHGLTEDIEGDLKILHQNGTSVVLKFTANKPLGEVL